MSSDKYSHITSQDRHIIEAGITNGATKAAIARTIGKDSSTVGKEIKLHRCIAMKCRLPLECANYKHCKYGRECEANCIDYVPFKCDRRDRSPGACNGCSNYTRCRFTKYRYEAGKAQKEYETTLVESREGVNLTTSEAKDICDIVAPLLKQGQSPYQIVTNHPELGICEKTLYNYLESGILVVIGDVSNMDLRRQVSRKISRKRKNDYKKREDRKYLNGRTYADFLAYMGENPDVNVTEMDTVYNDVANGPFIQTFILKGTQFIFALYHETRDSRSMKEGVDVLEEIFGKDLFEKLVHVLKTDRGGEFVLADEIEMRPDNTRRTRLYYCDPMQSGQKGNLENRHEAIRYIFPKGVDLRAIGLINQDALNLALSHVNSMPLESLNGKTPFEYINFMYPKLVERLSQFGIVKIPADNVTLKPKLLKDYCGK